MPSAVLTPARAKPWVRAAAGLSHPVGPEGTQVHTVLQHGPEHLLRASSKMHGGSFGQRFLTAVRWVLASLSPFPSCTDPSKPSPRRSAVLSQAGRSGDDLDGSVGKPACFCLGALGWSTPPELTQAERWSSNRHQSESSPGAGPA